MKLSEKFDIPDEAALLYDFVNTLDLRRYVEHGEAHISSDAIDTPAKLGAWLRERKLLARSANLGRGDHRHALALRDALRALFALAPSQRADALAVNADLDRAAARFPLTLHALGGHGLALQPSNGTPSFGLALVLAEAHALSVLQQLDRVKMCGSDECGWIFFDQSKPSNRRWCSTARCGNREKTRSYRDRNKLRDIGGRG